MKLSHLPIALVLSVTAVACSSTPGEDVGSGKGALKRASEESPEPVDPVERPRPDPVDPVDPPPPAPDAGTADSGRRLPLDIVVAADLATLTCANSEFDIVASGRTCAAFARTTSTGTWSALTSLPTAPAAVRDTHCLLTWMPTTSACAAPDYASLALSCVERRTFTKHSVCGTGMTCVPTGEILTTSVPKPVAGEPCSDSSAPGGIFFVAPSPKDPPPSPTPDPWDGGVIPGGYVGGCDACGIVSLDNLYITNPFGAAIILVNVTPLGSSTPQQLQIQAPATSTFVYPIGAGYQQTTAFVWK